MKLRAAAVSLLAAAIAAGSASAEEVTLKAVSSLGMNGQFGKIFALFVDHVNKEGKGVVQIRLIGGPEAIPPFEQGTAVKNGVVDIAHLAANYYENLMPEAAATSFGSIGPAEQRKNGAWAFLNKLHNEKVNAYLLASYGWGIEFHIYLRRKVDKADLTGMKLRATPGLQPFFKALGASSIATAPGEIYTALERGVVDGYSWPLWGINDLGWQRVTKYRIEPGWSNVSANIVVNLTRWNKLEPAQRDFLQKSAAWFEDATAKLIVERNEQEKKKQAEAGIQTITLAPDEGKRYRKLFYDTVWASMAQKSPQHVAKLKELLVR
ncbi:MAG: TRAP transporter substrate-binding protein DctP [Rhodospirillaceae bacterium]|nr:TRAP transporter substrate-binding protein DctP [Rhodospirillaceae bacterium]